MVNFKIDANEAVEKLDEFANKIPRQIHTAITEILDQAGMIAVTKYMHHTKASFNKETKKTKISGIVKDDKLNIQTGRLARSVMSKYSYSGGAGGNREGIRNVQMKNGKLIGIIGTKVPYAAIHEFGGTIKFKSGREITMPERSYLRRALNDLTFKKAMQRIIEKRIKEPLNE